jgi:hypothetical protein
VEGDWCHDEIDGSIDGLIDWLAGWFSALPMIWCSVASRYVVIDGNCEVLIPFP